MSPHALTFPLPVELAIAICQRAWQDSNLHAECQQLYDSLSVAHPILHQVILRLTIDSVIFDCTERLSAYQAATFYWLRAKEFAKLAGLPDAQEDLFALFRHSHVRVIGLYCSRQDTLNGAMTEKLLSVIKDCTSFTLAHHPLDESSRIASIHPVLTFLATFPSLAHLHIDGIMAGDSWQSIQVTIPSLTLLHLRAYPPCTCGGPVHYENGRPNQHRPSCLSTTLLRAFPNVLHIHLDTPFPLAELNAPLSLERWTLEAPLAEWSAGRDPFGSVLEYDIPAVVCRGVFHWRTRTGRRRVIVVHTGMEDPLGWTRAMQSCTEAGVELIKAVAYRGPADITDVVDTT